MKTINETHVLLYYRGYSQRPLICACESEQVANEEIHRLREEWPDIYIYIQNLRDLKPI